MKEYGGISEVPVPYDSLHMPPGPPIRVNSPEEAEQAQRTIRQRAGSVGATGIVVIDVTDDDGNGGMRLHRSILPVFVAADTARAYAACRTH